MPSGKPNFTNIKDKKIMIYKKVNKKNELDDIITEWTPVSDTRLWASYRSLSGSQLYAAAAVGFKADAIFTVNWREDIRPNMLVVYRKTIWDIIRVDDLEGYKKDLKLTCDMRSHGNSQGYPGVVL